MTVVRNEQVAEPGRWKASPLRKNAVAEKATGRGRELREHKARKLRTLLQCCAAEHVQHGPARRDEVNQWKFTSKWGLCALHIR